MADPPVGCKAPIGKSIRFTIALLAFTGSVHAQSRGADWKMYGAADLGKMGGEQRSFFDAAGVIRRDNGHVEVWTKTLSRKALDRAESNASGAHKKIIAAAVGKKLAGYLPPLSTVGELDDDTATQITADEAAADLGGIEPTMQILYELDCPNRLFREISLHVFLNGKLGTKETPSEWQHVPPETAAANLFKILCTKP
jgi:hypothetical protein